MGKWSPRYMSWGCGSVAWNDLTQGVWKISCRESKTDNFWNSCADLAAHIPHSRRICYFERFCQQESCSFKLPKAFLTALATVGVIVSSPKNKPMSHLNHTLWLFGINSWNCTVRAGCLSLAVWSLLWIFARFHQLPWSRVVHWPPWAADGHSCVDGAWPWEDVGVDISLEVYNVYNVYTYIYIYNPWISPSSMIFPFIVQARSSDHAAMHVNCQWQTRTTLLVSTRTRTTKNCLNSKQVLSSKPMESIRATTGSFHDSSASMTVL